MKPTFLFFFLFALGSLAFSQAPIRVEFQISNSTDDAEERGSNASSSVGRMDLTSSDLELVRDGSDGDQFVGLRFIQVNIPTNAIVTNAYIQFTVDEDDDIPGTKIIQIEDAADPATYVSTDFNISSRNVLSQSVSWTNIPVWNNVGDATIDQRTPDLSELINAAIRRNGWTTGNALNFIITGTGERVAESFDGSPNDAPMLVIEYQIPQSLELQVSQSTDDAEERGANASSSPGRMDLTSSDLELVRDGSDGDQFVGIRFQNLDIPSQATITNAYIQFTVDEEDDIPGDKLIQVENSSAPSTYSSQDSNISSRSLSAESVLWTNIPVWSNRGDATEDQRTPNLSSLVQSIINRGDWVRGNPINFVITGQGERVAESYDGSSSDAPKLIVEYTTPVADFDLQMNSIEGIDPITYPITNGTLSATIENVGLQAISNFTISYRLDNETPVVENPMVTLNPGETYVHNFVQGVSVNGIGNHQLTVTVDAVEDNFDFNDSLTYDFQVVEQVSDVYFDTNSAWKYLDDGSDLGTAWRTPSFDDSSWKIGTGHFGFGEGDTEIELQPDFVTYYFRKEVNVSDTNNLNPLVLNLVSDDGAIVYVNGIEVYRSPTLPSGTINFDTETEVIVETEFENLPIPISLDPIHFQNGINTIAIELHNAFAGNVDLSFSAAITNEDINYQTDGPYVYRRNGELIIKQVTENGPTTTTLPGNAEPVLTSFLPDGRSFDFQLQSTPYSIVAPEYPLPSKFFAVSDIEGQIEAFAFLLENAGVIDSDFNWTYGDGHLFVLGDVFDRGLYVTECLWLIYKLEQEALAAGGAVHFIPGNHEYFNLNGNFQDARSKYMFNSRHLDETMYSFYDANSEFGKWFRSKNIIENAGNSAIFIHAGISPQVSEIVNQQNLSYAEINDFGRIGMDDRDCDVINDPNALQACQAINGSTDIGIYWYRGMAREELTQNQVDNIINNFGGEVVMFGHSITSANTITPLYNQKVINIDVRHDSNFNSNGYMEGLLYENGCYNKFITDGNTNTTTKLDPDCEESLSTTEVANLNQGLILAPNPVKDILNLRTSQPITNATITIHSSVGNLIDKLNINKSFTSLEINTSSWPTGVYFIKIEYGNTVITKKVIKI